MRVHVLIAILLAVAAARAARLPAPYAREPKPGTEIVSPVDGALMVWVPSGEFIMGMDKDRADRTIKALGYKGGWEQAWAWEWAPEHRVYVAGFFIDRYEVTRRLWEAFVAATGHKSAGPARKGPVENIPGEFGLYPVAQVTWADAQAYANWAGKGLPYEAQWEKAARGSDGRTFPWGEELPTEERGSFVNLANDAPTMFSMVGSHPKGDSPYGCSDMAGNVYEWTCEFEEPYPNNPYAARMQSYAGHTNGCLRGGSFYHGKIAYISAKRFGFEPQQTYYHVGFRTVWTPPASYFTTPAFREAQQRVTAAKAELARLRATGNPAPPKYWD